MYICDLSVVNSNRNPEIVLTPTPSMHEQLACGESMRLDPFAVRVLDFGACCKLYVGNWSVTK